MCYVNMVILDTEKMLQTPHLITYKFHMPPNLHKLSCHTAELPLATGF